MERILDEAMLARFRHSNDELGKYLGLSRKALLQLGLADQGDPGIFERAGLTARMFLWRHWWSYTDETRNLRGRQILREAAQGAQTNAPFAPLLTRQESGLAALQLTSSADHLAGPLGVFGEPNLHFMLSDSVVTMSGCLRRVLTVETTKRLTVTAIALKRFDLRHGSFPEQLNQLTPEFLPAVPLDPVDAQPLRYRRNGDGTFVLYSIGPDNKDDGGEPSLGKGAASSSYNWLGWQALDWVWPQPATEAEIGQYFAERANKSN